MPNPQLFWRADVFCSGCLPYLTSPDFKASGTRFSPPHVLAILMLPRSHDVDMHVLDLVGTSGITQVLLVCIFQQSTYPRGHPTPLAPIP